MRSTLVGLIAIAASLLPGCKKNHAPDTPAVPSGPTSCAVGVEYAFSSSATDPDGDSVSIRFDWGDGDTSAWSAYARSGDTVRMSHAWAAPGVFSIMAQARTRLDAASVWSAGAVLSTFHEWTRTYGGELFEWGQSIQQTTDGGYVIAGVGSLQLGSGYCVWLAKTDAGGNLVWTRTFGGFLDDYGYSVQQTRDGGYVVVGSTCTHGAGSSDVWLIKTDSEGHETWDRTFCGADADWSMSVGQTQEGGYIIVGATCSNSAGYDDVWFIKTDAAGNEVWDRIFGGTQEDCGNSVEQTPDGGYIIAGTTSSFGAGLNDVWIIRTDTGGSMTWSRTYGGSGYDDGNSVQQTQDGGYIIAAYTESYDVGMGDVWPIKTDAVGNEDWARSFGGVSVDVGYSARQTKDGGYIVAGYSESFGAGDEDVWLIKTDASGDSVWSKTYGGAGMDQCKSVRQTEDGGYILAGTTSSYGAGQYDVWAIKTGPNGEVDEGGGK